jgi:hypothetical protein
MTENKRPVFGASEMRHATSGEKDGDYYVLNMGHTMMMLNEDYQSGGHKDGAGNYFPRKPEIDFDGNTNTITVREVKERLKEKAALVIIENATFGYGLLKQATMKLPMDTELTFHSCAGEYMMSMKPVKFTFTYHGINYVVTIAPHFNEYNESTINLFEIGDEEE